MARVKRGVTAHAKHKKVLKAALRLLRRPQPPDQNGEASRRKGAAVRLYRPQAEEARFARALDPAYQRRHPRTRADVRTLYQRPDQPRHRCRSEDAVGYPHQRPEGFKALVDKAAKAAASPVAKKDAAAKAKKAA